jgi:NitT/TauT family transport system substrate-binding protein
MMTRPRLWNRIVSAVLLAGAVVALSGPATVAQTSESLIRFGAAADDNAMPILYADKAGLYKKYGLNVQIIRFTNAASATAALVGGSLDMSKNSALGLINAIQRGLPLTAIGSIGYYNADKPDYALVVAANSAIKVPKDLEGKTLSSISLQDMSSIATFGWLEQRGVDFSTIKYVEIPAAATLAAIEQGQAVGATMSEPFLSANLATGKVRVLGYPYSALGKQYSASVLFAAAKWAGEHPDLVTKFLKATQEASVYVGGHENTDELRQLIAQYTGVDPAAIANQRHPGRGVILTPGDLQPVIDYAAKYKVISKAFPAQEMICACALSK